MQVGDGVYNIAENKGLLLIKQDSCLLLLADFICVSLGSVCFPACPLGHLLTSLLCCC